MTWLEHVNKWKDCTRCPLHTQRGLICLARGALPCDVLFVGEAPGASEDARGIPFDGPAGQLLDRIVERALRMEYSYCMTNLVACFPREAKARGDNEPEEAEILACRPRLLEMLDMAKPKVVVCVGGLAKKYMPECSARVVSIVHPAHILRNMPAVQKNMAANKCVVQIRTALREIQGGQS